MKAIQTIDWVLYIVVFLLVGLGLMILYSLSYSSQTQNLFRDQVIFAIIGLILMVVFTFFDYRSFKGAYIYLYIVGLILLVLVLFFGKVSYGASRWLDFKIFQLQPSEVFKFILIISLASYLSKNAKEFRFRNFMAVILIILMPIILVLIQPDFGTAFILFTIGIGMIIAANIQVIYLFILGIMGLISAPIVWFFGLRGYQKDRLITFLNPQGDPFGSGYNVLQSIIAIGSGMVKGKGFGKGLQSQLKFLPASHTDFIFAVFAEELGFIGSIVILIIFLILIFKIIKIAKIASDDFGTLICVGVVILILLQVFVNIGMNIGLMPVTGIPLPFISSGGTSLIVTLILMGILQSITLRHKKLTFS